MGRGTAERYPKVTRGGAGVSCHPPVPGAAGDTPSSGLLKGPQKNQILFWELHGGFCIVDNAENKI